jgi:hypothetical protein
MTVFGYLGDLLLSRIALVEAKLKKVGFGRNFFEPSQDFRP